MFLRKAKGFHSCFAALLLLTACASDSGGPVRRSSLTVAAVQFEVDIGMCASLGDFDRAIAGIVKECMAGGKPDVVIFPEYTGAFIALIPYYRAVKDKQSIAGIMEGVRKVSPAVSRPPGIFIEQSSFVESSLDGIFGRLCREYDIFIVGGTYLARSGDSLSNRALVFGPSGKRIYAQDKVFLTPIEREVFRIVPGRVDDARGFTVKGKTVFLSICRDTLFREWEDKFSGGDLWIDIKANGTEFTREEEKSFEDFLPARLSVVDVPYGVTVCLTGRFLGFFWEGRSSFIAKQGDRAVPLSSARGFRNREIIIEELLF